MYIKLATDKNPLDLKVAGGFKAESPILKIVSYQILMNEYVGTPASSFIKPPTNILPDGIKLSVTVKYFRSYQDYLGLESQILFTTSTNLSEINDQNLPNSFYNLTIDGDVTLQSIHDALKNKLKDSFPDVSVVSE